MGRANPTLIMVPAASAWIDTTGAQTLAALGRDGEALEALGRARAAREILIKANPAVIRNYKQLIRARGDFQMLMLDLAFPKDPFARGR